MFLFFGLINFLINEVVAVLISLSSLAITAFPKSIIPNIINLNGKGDNKEVFIYTNDNNWDFEQLNGSDKISISKTNSTLIITSIKDEKEAERQRIIEKQYGRRPVIFLTNGFETRIIDNQYPERKCSVLYSKRDLEYMKRVYESAMFIADYLGWSAVRCDKDGKMRSIEEIHEDVYKLTAAIYDNVEAITSENAKGAELSIENATSGLTVPFHKGAAKYFAEKGVTVAVE
mgnify:CR=1 FL=1